MAPAIAGVRACVFVRQREEKEERRAFFYVRASAHVYTCVAAFCEKAPDFQLVPWSLFASLMPGSISLCDLRTFPSTPYPPAHSTVGHKSKGEISSPRRLQHLNLSGENGGGWG